MEKMEQKVLENGKNQEICQSDDKETMILFHDYVDIFIFLFQCCREPITLTCRYNWWGGFCLD